MSQLAGVAVAGIAHDEYGARDVQLKVELHHHEGTAQLLVIPVGITFGRPVYELPVDALKVAIASLPLKELLRVVKEART